MKRVHPAWLVLLGLIVALLVWAANLTPEGLVPLISARFPRVDWIDTDTLAERIGGDDPSKPILLDTRSLEEFAVSHLPGAVRVDPKQPELDAIEFPTDGAVVVYCSIGYRSAAIAQQLEALGVGSVHNLRGGIFAWANEGNPIVRDSALVDEVHPYDALWGRLLRPELRWSPTQ